MAHASVHFNWQFDFKLLGLNLQIVVPGKFSLMNVQERLEAFDSWLTGRIDEAFADRRDLAFRDRVAEFPLGDEAWEYCLLEPGSNSPHGEGWSVYRLQGVWPKSPTPPVAPAQPERKSLLGALVDALRKPDGAKSR